MSLSKKAGVKSVIILVGCCGVGKSGMIYDWTNNKSAKPMHTEEEGTTQVKCYDGPNGQVIIDTVGFAGTDLNRNDDQTFKLLLKYMLNKGYESVKAIIWCLDTTNIRKTMHLRREAIFINMFSKNVWEYVVLHNKMMPPGTYPEGANGIAKEISGKDLRLPNFGYTYYTKEWMNQKMAQLKQLGVPPFDERQKKILRRNELHLNASERAEEINKYVNQIWNKNDQKPLVVIFTNKKCVKCQIISDPRLVRPDCHVKVEKYHFKTIPIIYHPKSVKSYHPDPREEKKHRKGKISKHYGDLEKHHLLAPKTKHKLPLKITGGGQSDWEIADGYTTAAAGILPVVGGLAKLTTMIGSAVHGGNKVVKKFPCCEKDESSSGCSKHWVCCDSWGTDDGCQETYTCCKLVKGAIGCKFDCCENDKDDGCITFIKCCEKNIDDIGEGCQKRMECCKLTLPGGNPVPGCKQKMECCKKIVVNNVIPTGCKERCSTCFGPWGEPPLEGFNCQGKHKWEDVKTCSY